MHTEKFCKKSILVELEDPGSSVEFNPMSSNCKEIETKCGSQICNRAPGLSDFY